MTEINKYENGLTNRPSATGGFGNALTFFLVGGGIGAVVALLFAPKAGNELRGEIADVTRKGYDATLAKASDLKIKSADAVQKVKEKAEGVYDFAAEKLASSADSVKESTKETVSKVAGGVHDGIDRMKNESGLADKAGAGRKSSSIF